MSGDELARLRAVCEAATPGPWRMTESGTHAGPAVVWGVHCDVVTSANALSDDEDDHRDARAIAALGSLWPELLAVVEAAHDPRLRAAAPAIAGEDGDRMRETASAEQWNALNRLFVAGHDLRAAIRERLGDGDA